MMQLVFQSEYPVALLAIVAFVLAMAVGWYYHRETRSLALPHRWLLPILRGLAIAMVIMMLAGPTIRYRRETGTIPTVNVFVDASTSMDHADAGSAVDGSGGTPRIDAATTMILGDESSNGWLRGVGDTHRVKLFVVSGDTARQVYDSVTINDQPPPQTLDIDDADLDRTITNLAEPLKERITPARASADVAGSGVTKQRSGDVVVLLSDGRHNEGTSPEEFAKRLGDDAMPMFTIGFGRTQEPRDLAILDMDLPPLVASNGRAAGTISIKDLGEPGQAFQVQIRSGDTLVWEQRLTSLDQPSRRVPFDFPVGDLVQSIGGEDESIQRTRVTIPLQVSISPVDGELDSANNDIDYRLAASTRMRRVLIVDSRSRWETRYIRNVFDRDPTWAVTTLILWAESGGADTLDATASFPRDSRALATYDVIVWGDVGRRDINDDQLQMVKDFVAQGGGIVFVDGERDYLSMMKDSPIGDLIPVRFANPTRITLPMRWKLSTAGGEIAAMRLHNDADGSQQDSALQWSNLRPPTSIRNVVALPGSETWLQAAVSTDTRAPGIQTDAPVLVTRPYGAGQTVYMATDQTWRWRYQVADLYHARFWNQLLETVMQAPFDVRDQYVSLSTGAAQYQAGDSVPIRVQLRDADGQPASDAIVDAVLTPADSSSGSETQVVALRLVDPTRGVYMGESSALAPGEYVASVRAAGYAASAGVTGSFVVTKPINRELVRLSQNVELLQTMATSSGGLYADASQSQTVWDAIKPLSDGRIQTQRWPLAQSWVWFAALLGILATEWWLRKRVGLV